MLSVNGPAVFFVASKLLDFFIIGEDDVFDSVKDKYKHYYLLVNLYIIMYHYHSGKVLSGKVFACLVAGHGLKSRLSNIKDFNNGNGTECLPP